MSTILHIASWYPNPADPRLGNFVEEHLKAINTKLPVVLLSAFEHEEEKMILTEEPFVHLQVLYRKKWPVQSLYKALESGYRRLEQMGYQFKMAHLHVSWPSGIVFQGFLKELPYIITEHYSGYQSKRRHEWSRLAQQMAKRILNRAQAVCPVSNQLAQSLREFGVKSTIEVIGNVVNTQVFAYQPQRRQAGFFRFLHISSLQQETKNVLGLLKGFALALNRDPNLNLSIGGDGDLSWLRAQIEVLDIPAPNFRILPAMSRAEVAQEMGESDAFVLFSFIENQPVVLLESLCLGRPVIATKVGGIPEYIKKEQGLLIPSEDEEALAQAFLNMKANYHQYDAAALSIAAQSRYSFEAIAEEFIQLYLSVRPSVASDLLNQGPEPQ